MRYPSGLIGAVAGLALVALPLSPASAHGRHHDDGLLFGLMALGTAAVIGAATLATAPVQAAPPPAYGYAPVYAAPAPAYYPPPQVYYAQPRVYYAPPPGYYAPPGYVYVR